VGTLTEVLEVNWIILYFIYGQVFFVMGLVTALQWRQPSRLDLARPLLWLAGFGIAHGLNEWGYIFVPLQALYLQDRAVSALIVIHLLLLTFSFFCLFQFGIELLLPARGRLLWLRAVPGITFLVWGIAVLMRMVWWQDPLNVLTAIGDSWSRYLLCIPGSLAACLGLLRQARQVREMGLPRIAFYLTGAAIAFLVYAFVGGLIVPSAPVFPANLLNYSLMAERIQVPVPVFRSLCGLAMAYFVVRSLEVFQVETDRRIAEMERAQMLAADRERIGRELHDGIIQNIYAAGLSLERVQHQESEDPERARQIGSILEILNQTIRDIRSYIYDLRAAEHSHELEAVLQDLVRDLRLDTLLEVDLRVRGQRCQQMDSRQMAHLAQIAREALSNVIQHAQAHHVTVSLRYGSDDVCLTITDDGQGGASEALRDKGNVGNGLANMRERARQLGGTFELQSKPGDGTRLSVTAPCDSVSSS
jgi:signal transduction histidine kinase